MDDDSYTVRKQYTIPKNIIEKWEALVPKGERSKRITKLMDIDLNQDDYELKELKEQLLQAKIEVKTLEGKIKEKEQEEILKVKKSEEIKRLFIEVWPHIKDNITAMSYLAFKRSSLFQDYAEHCHMSLEEFDQHCQEALNEESQ